MKARVLLVKCNEDASARFRNRAEKTLSAMPSLGIMYIAAVLRQDGWPVEILDAEVHGLYGADFQKAVQEANPQIIGFTSTTLGWPSVVEAARLAKQACPQATIVMGGPHLQIFPRESVSFPWVDMAVTGDGEETILEVVRNYDGGGPLDTIPGTCVKVDGEVRLNSARPWIRNLDEIPFPAVDLAPWDKYYTLTMKRPFFTMITTRGCPWKCAFCSQVYAADTIRYRSAENVVDEMEIYVKKYGARELRMWDETFTVKKSRVMKICRLITERKLRFTFDMRTRVDCVDEEMLLALKAAGCRRIHFGIESGSPRILEKMNKGITVEKVRSAAMLCKKLGISIVGLFMIGYLDEDMESYAETIRFSRQLPLEWVSYAITTPVPHTSLHDEAVKRGYLLSDYWRDYTLLKKEAGVFPHLPSQHWDEKKLQKMLSSAYSGFYLRPAFVWQRLTSIRSLDDIKDLARGLRVVMTLAH